MPMERFQLYVVAVILGYFAILTVPAVLRYPLAFTEEFSEAVMNTVVLSTISTLITLPLALVLAQGSLRSPGRTLAPLVTATVSVPHTAIGVLLAPLVFGAGLVDTPAAIVIAMTIVSLPIGFTALRSALVSLGTGYFEFLAGMGVTGWRVIPIAIRSIRSALVISAILSWFRAFSELGAVLILARRPTTIGVYIFENFLAWGAAPVVGGSVALLALAVAVGFLIERLTGVARGK